MANLTQEAYEAAGALLGLSYSSISHTFHNSKEVYSTGKAITEYDPDTMEPLSADEVMRRVQWSIENGRGYWLCEPEKS